MSENKKNIGLRALLKANGMLFPTTPEDIIDFEKNNNIELEKPENFENPVNIILEGKRKISNIDFVKKNISNHEIENLAMAARDGKVISEEVRNKMREDRNNAKKKQ